MNRSDAESLMLRVDDAHAVSGLLLAPSHARACYVFAHGAGAGMFHPFMEAVARELAQRRIATLRYQFPYMEQGGKRPDPPKLAQATVRAAVAKAADLMPALPLFAGGKSFGGRMTSQAQAALVRFGGARGPAQFADELQGGGADLLVRGRRLEVIERADVSTHECPRRPSAVGDRRIRSPPQSSRPCAGSNLIPAAFGGIRGSAKHHRDLNSSAPLENFHRNFVDVTAHLEVDAGLLELQIAQHQLVQERR